MSFGFLLSLVTAISCVVFIGAVVNGLLVPRSQRDEILKDRDEWRQSFYSFREQLVALHERNGFVSGALPSTRTPVGCQHPEYIDVTTPVYPGEVVARLCTNPECYAQLPADFEPPKPLEAKQIAEYADRLASLHPSPLLLHEPTRPLTAADRGLMYHSENGKAWRWNGSEWYRVKHSGRGVHEGPDEVVS